MMENPLKMDDLGVPLFLETPKCSFFRVVTHVDVLKTNPPIPSTTNNMRGYRIQTTGQHWTKTLRFRLHEPQEWQMIHYLCSQVSFLNQLCFCFFHPGTLDNTGS